MCSKHYVIGHGNVKLIQLSNGFSLFLLDAKIVNFVFSAKLDWSFKKFVQ